MTNRWANIVFSIALIIACVVFSLMALQFENPGALAGAQVPTQVFPLMMLGFTAVCAGINIFNYLRGDPEGDAEEPFDFGPAVAIRVVLIIGVVLLSIFLWDLVGFIPASIILTIGIGVLMQVRSIPTYIFLAVFGPASWAAFKYGIGIEF